MAIYTPSRVLCTTCNVWMANNKVSRESHERGGKHQAMVQKRVRDGQRKERDQEKQDRELARTLRDMEYAALARMKKDAVAGAPTDTYGRSGIAIRGRGGGRGGGGALNPATLFGSGGGTKRAYDSGSGGGAYGPSQKRRS